MMDRYRDRGTSKDSDKQKDKDALKITNQARIRDGMAYTLKCDGIHLILVVTPRSSESDRGEWLVEARARRAPADFFVAAEWGTTRIEALRAVGRSWDASLQDHGLAMFDWEAVARVLGDVRAL